ncbi:MAG: signal peptidase [Frankiales bacterium]|nr:signal peptidase [Frankiales bacterium]
MPDKTTADETAADEMTPGARTSPRHRRSFLRELPFLVIVAFVLALLIKHFFVQAFYIPSQSMEQTLMVGDRVLVNKLAYDFRSPHRGEIVVFNGLDNFDEGVTISQPTNPVAKVLRTISNTVGLGAPDEKDYIKRVVGIAGDRVMCCDTAGKVVLTPKGGQPVALDEPYVYENDTSETRYFCEAGLGQSKCQPGALGVLVPNGRLWVMGDHRGNSYDSRGHLGDGNHGTVPEDKVVGKAFTIVYPFDRIGLLRVPSTFEHVALPAAPYALGLAAAVPFALVRRRRLR